MSTRVRHVLSREARLRALLPHLHVGMPRRGKLHIISASSWKPLCGLDPEIVEEGPLEDYRERLCKHCARIQGDEYADE